MHEGYSNCSVCLCVCVSVSVIILAATYMYLILILHRKQGDTDHGLFQDMQCHVLSVDFMDNALFRNSGDI